MRGVFLRWVFLSWSFCSAAWRTEPAHTGSHPARKQIWDPNLGHLSSQKHSQSSFDVSQSASEMLYIWKEDWHSPGKDKWPIFCHSQVFKAEPSNSLLEKRVSAFSILLIKAGSGGATLERKP